MKIFNRSLIEFSVFLSLFLFFGQMTFAQENQCKQITIDYLVAKLRSTSPEADSKEKIIKELKSEIIERKMFSAPSYGDEKELRRLGANDSLIKTISENLSMLPEEAGSLYNLYSINYPTNDTEKIKKALEAAKEYVRIFENDGCYIKQVNYFKEAIPILEKSLRDIQSKDNIYDPVNPKRELRAILK